MLWKAKQSSQLVPLKRQNSPGKPPSLTEATVKSLADLERKICCPPHLKKKSVERPKIQLYLERRPQGNPQPLNLTREIDKHPQKWSG